MGDSEDINQMKEKIENAITDLQQQLEYEQKLLLDEIADKAKKKKALMVGEVESDYDSFFTKS